MLLQLFDFIIVVVTLLPCLIYKLNSIVGMDGWMDRKKKTSIYRVWSQASTGGPGMCPHGRGGLAYNTVPEDAEEGTDVVPAKERTSSCDF